MRRVVTGVVVALAVASGLVVGCGPGGDGKHLVRAEFKDAAGLRTGSLVRVSGASGFRPNRIQRVMVRMAAQRSAGERPCGVCSSSNTSSGTPQ